MNLDSCKKLKTIPTGIYLNSLDSLDSLDLDGCSGLESVPEIITNISEQQPFTPLMTWLYISRIPSLVEFSSSIQNFHKLKYLNITGCTNLETLPTGINLQSLEQLDLDDCSRLRSFPNISTNIKKLNLSDTAIEEVPWWIENFSRLSELSMRRCNNLRRVSLNILKLKHLKATDFLYCGALTEASWDDSASVAAMTTDNIHSRLPDNAASSLPDGYISMVELYFFGCLNFDHKVLLQQQTVIMGVILSGEEVPSYFTHRTTGTSLTNIPLPHTSPYQPFLRFKACALCDIKDAYSFEIQVCFRFIDISGNHFDYADLPRKFSSSTWGLGRHLVIFDCCFPLADQLNYDHVDIQFCLTEAYFGIQLEGYGILLPENGQLLDNRPCNPNILPHVYGGNTSNNAYLLGHETVHWQECGDSAVESNTDTPSHVFEADEDNVVNDGCHETAQSVEFVDSDEETVRNNKRMRIS